MTSCGRADLLKQTLGSFLRTNTYPIKKYLIVDDSGDVTAQAHIESILRKFNEEIPINFMADQENVGQVRRIDQMYAWVETPYIYHTEDDWLHTGEGYIEKSLDLLEFDPNVCNVNLRVRFDGERGSMHPILPLQQTTNGTEFHYYPTHYEGIWHGFSWNPGLRRLADYEKVKPYINLKNEQGVGQKLMELGYRAACLKESYCKHLGTYSQTPKPNQ
jgi:GT2 family glycosyltransferase